VAVRTAVGAARCIPTCNASFAATGEMKGSFENIYLEEVRRVEEHRI